MERYYRLLEVYTLLDILASLDLEEADVLRILDEQGYLEALELPEPL